MEKKLKGPIHDHLFKGVYQGTRYALDIFSLVLTKREFQLFNWKTLRSELTDYIDEEGKEKRADLVFSVSLKSSKKKAKILFLFEHKAQRRRDLFSQMLTYQAAIYSRRDDPVIP
ncbi:MAG: Rpn family recombination-promoting nuclease/putative transposase, partial [Bacteriovoracales bacterium]|nr:Rpn family recombination-promoting nuclease/putative transposase [Bacteriovoracales bacterium]